MPITKVEAFRASDGAIFVGYDAAMAHEKDLLIKNGVEEFVDRNISGLSSITMRDLEHIQKVLYDNREELYHLFRGD